MVFDLDRMIGNLDHLGVGDAKALAIRLGHGDILCSAMATGVDHPHLLATQRPAQNGAVSEAKRRLVDVEFIGIDRALDDVFAKPVDTGDEDDVTKAGFRIQRECNAAGGAVGPHHLHHADRKGDLEMVEPIVGPIGDRAVGENGSKAAPTGVDQILRAADVEEALVLAGKACRRKVFGRRRAADRNRDIGAVLAFELPVRTRNLLAEGGRCRWLGRRSRVLRRRCLARTSTRVLSRPSRSRCSLSHAPAAVSASR